MDDMQNKLVKNVKPIIEEMFSDDFELPDVKFSTYISSKLYKVAIIIYIFSKIV
jgi:hypothetical protein